MATFILIHGAWHGGWCWERLAPLLEAAGHDVVAPDLPGMGSDRTQLTANPLAAWRDFTAGIVAQARAPVILVGHSRAGLTISEVAERMPNAISRLVYLSAFLLQSGQSLADIAGQYPEVGPASAIRPSDDPHRISIDPQASIPIFYNLTPEAEAQAAADRLVSEPIAAFTTPITVSATQFGTVPRVYIETEHDRAISLEMQRAMQAILPCDQTVTLNTDHSPFYSSVEDLRDVLLDSI